jgi:anaerobic ribonucleoside-triphosphate reductase
MMPEFEASRRSATLDIEKYGLAEVHVQSERDEPHYADLSMVPLNLDVSLEKYLGVEEKLHELASGCHLAKIPLGPNDGPEQLFSTTRKIVKSKVGFYAFDKVITYCGNCQKTFSEKQAKCPRCGSVNAVTRFRRRNARYGAET